MKTDIKNRDLVKGEDYDITIIADDFARAKGYKDKKLAGCTYIGVETANNTMSLRFDIGLGQFLYIDTQDESKRIITKHETARTIMVTRDKIIDVDNIRLNVVFELEGDVFETEMQYNVSTNTCHHSNIKLEDELEERRVDIEDIIDQIEGREIIFGIMSNLK